MKQFIYSPPAIIILTLITVFLIISLRGNLEKVDISRQNFLNIQQDVTELRDNLKPKKQRLESAQQPLAKEKIARNELLKKKPGEYVLYIQDVELNKEEIVPTPTPLPIEEWRNLLGV